MLINDSNQKITIRRLAEMTTREMPVSVSYRSVSASAFTPASLMVNTSGTTDIDILPTPASGVSNIADYINIFNADTTVATVSVRKTSTDPVLTITETEVALAPNERLQYTDQAGWQVFSSTGSLKQSINQGANAVSPELQLAKTTADVTNNNAVANTMQDIPELSIPMIAGKLYRFKFEIQYTAAATSTGSRWGVNASAGTAANLSFDSEYSLTSTTTTRNALIQAFDSPAASNATSATTGNNRCRMEGSIRATANGNLVARFASEVASSAIVAKTGSFVEWRQID
jgi:hypothetical protein